MRTTLSTITAEQCKQLAREAAEVGDVNVMHDAHTAARYLENTVESHPEAYEALTRCVRVINDAEAQASTDGRFGFEVRAETGQWTREGAGQQDGSNAFATREDAEREIPQLAATLKCDPAEIRVVAL